MRKRWLSVALIALPAFGQIESNTVTVTATRSISVQPDQAVFSLYTSSTGTASLDQIVAALSSLGVTSANLTSVNNYSASTTVQWQFTLAAPLSNLTTTIASITTLQQSIGQNNSGLSLSFSINGTQVSQQLQQSQACSNSDLISDATTQAQKLTSAVGMALGPIIKLSTAPAIPVSIQPVAARLTIAELLPVTAWNTPTTFALVGTPLPGLVPVVCSLIVKFQLLP